MKPPKPPSNTEIAIDDVVGSAASEVERRLEAEGLAAPRVTPRDVLRSRYPNDSIDDEAITEQMAEFVVDPPPISARARGLRTPTPLTGSSSISPISIEPRPRHTPGPFSAVDAPRPNAHARRVAARGGQIPRGRTRTFLSRAPSGAWILALITLGGVTAFTAVMAARSPGFLGPSSAPLPPRAAAVAPPAPALGDDAGAPIVAPTASATAPSTAPLTRPRSGRPTGPAPRPITR